MNQLNVQNTNKPTTNEHTTAKTKQPKNVCYALYPGKPNVSDR